MTKQVWVPLADGKYVHDSIIDGRIEMTVANSGEDVCIDGPMGVGEYREQINFSPFTVRLCQLVEDATPAPLTMDDDNGGRRWWRMKRGDDSQAICINIAEMEWYWKQGWRPDYPIEAQPLELLGSQASAQGGESDGDN